MDLSNQTLSENTYFPDDSELWPEPEHFMEWLNEKTEHFLLTKEKERELMELHPELEEMGMEMRMESIRDIYEFRPDFYDELVVNVPDINVYVKNFNGISRVTMGTGMPFRGALHPKGNAASCWNSGVKGQDLVDASKGRIDSRACADATNTGNVTQLDYSGGILYWQMKGGTKKQWMAWLFSHLMNLQYAYEFDPNASRAQADFDIAISGTVLESEPDGSNPKAVTTEDKLLVFKQRFDTAKHSPAKGGKTQNFSNRIKSFEFEMKPQKLYTAVIKLHNYVTCWHAKAAARAGYQHLPFS